MGISNYSVQGDLVFRPTLLSAGGFLSLLVFHRQSPHFKTVASPCTTTSTCFRCSPVTATTANPPAPHWAPMACHRPADGHTRTSIYRLRVEGTTASSVK